MNWKIYIPKINFEKINQVSLFVLTRPFFIATGWINDNNLKEKWGIKSSFEYTSSIKEANFVILPLPINWYYKNNKQIELEKINAECKQLNKKVYAIISGDFGRAYPELSNFFYYRMGGFKSQLTPKNSGFPVPLSDHFQRLYKTNDPIPNIKTEHPKIGFCGHASKDFSKRIKELVKCSFENVKRFIENPLRKDWEPLFASAYERRKLLNALEKSTFLDCQFIYRKNYRGGAKTNQEREKTTLEYYDNLLKTDYVLCVRGAGNFSVRFYEALMMGKIPIFVNTDCLLPLEDEIDWKKQVVWVEWKERHKIAEIVIDFHKKISNEDFILLQQSNRKIWKEKLTTSYYLDKISNAF
jgi:hypothetical protein